MLTMGITLCEVCTLTLLGASAVANVNLKKYVSFSPVHGLQIWIFLRSSMAAAAGGSLCNWCALAPPNVLPVLCLRGISQLQSLVGVTVNTW